MKILSKQSAQQRKCKHIWPREENFLICRLRRLLRIWITFSVHIALVVSTKELPLDIFHSARTCNTTNRSQSRLIRWPENHRQASRNVDKKNPCSPQVS